MAPENFVARPSAGASLRERKVYENALQLDTAVFVAEEEDAEKRAWAGEFDSVRDLFKFLEGNESRLRAVAAFATSDVCGGRGSGCRRRAAVGSPFCVKHRPQARVRSVQCKIGGCGLKVCRGGKCRKHYDADRQVNV